MLSLVVLTAIGFNQYTFANTTTTKTNAASNATTTSTATQSVTLSYSAATTVDIGMLVQLKPGTQNTVEPLKQNNLAKVLGVAVQQNQSAITLVPQSVANQQVYVSTSGRVDVLVCNENGPINSGDLITVSSLDGISMKADSSENEIVGKAAAPFSGTTNVVGTAKITNSLGKSVNIPIGMIPINLDISDNPLASKATDYVPSFLSKAASAVASKPVSAARIYLSFAIIILSSFLTANMIYSGVRNGMVAVGRNPLSKKSIIRSLIQTVIAGLIIFIGGIFGVYLLLKL